MKLKFAAICFIAFWASSCKWGVPPKRNPAITTDTLTYGYKVLKQRANDCGNKPDSECTVVTIKYPIFNGQKKLNDFITRKLNSIYAISGRPDSSLTQFVKDFLAYYKNFKRDNPKSTIFFTIDDSSKVIRQDSSIVTLQINAYSFAGGAHPSEYTCFINWDIKANKSIALNDLFILGYQENLNKFAEGVFRKNEKLNGTASLATDYFFKNGKFLLNNNFSITPIGLRFFYNEYEIKPYAAGTTDLFIPYTQIKSLLRPHTVVSQYIK